MGLTINTCKGLAIDGSRKRNPYWKTLSSGLVRYRKGIDKTTGQYVLDYSDDGGVTWENIVSLDPTEETILKVTTYRHRIVGTAYHIDEALTPTGFAGIENTDWINIYTT